ncbi:ABC transporter substrate-binding protein [Streptomyces sp. NA02950]|uniref:ABC transporter substrate-binding protein n=1 Tax=Streptomyces sp. NA02950 TaxID=2742137 RepID=UPI0020CB6167|nr:extracellular solute-binding protein [Streptomyces sp. NA02950]
MNTPLGIDRRRLLRLGGALAAAASLSACSGSGGTGGAGDKNKASLTVWSWQEPAKALKALVPEFRRKHPGIKVTVEDIGNPAIWDKITTAMAARGEGLADVLHIGVDYLPGYTEKFPDGLADLGELGANKYRRAFASGLWRTVSPDGSRVNALPWEANSAGFWYREDLFRRAGVEAGSLATWDDAIEAGKKIKAKTGTRLIGMDKPASQADAANFFQMLLQLQGTFYFNADGDITLDSPEAVRAMKIIKRLNDAGLVDDYSGGWSTMVSSLKKSTVAVQPMPTWFGGVIEREVPQQKGKWRVQLPPAVHSGGSRSATVNSTHLAVAGSSPHQAAAWSFVEYVLTRPASQAKIYRSAAIAPALMKAYDDAAFHEPSAYFGGQKRGEVFLRALQAPSRAFNYSADYARALKVVTDAQTKVLLKGADAAEVLGDAADRLGKQTGRKIVR